MKRGILLFKFKYLNRFVLALVLAALAGITIRTLLVPKNFGLTGHYRADSPAEVADREPVHQGKEVCAECHSSIVETHDRDMHFTVQCENCHGAGQKHVTYHHTAGSGQGTKAVQITAAEAQMQKFKKGQVSCLICHRKIKAVRRDYPQIDIAEHYGNLHVKSKETDCFPCHSPHEPFHYRTKKRALKEHPAIQECWVCHFDKPLSDVKPVGHPITFECAFCHKEKAADHKTRKHSFLRCTSCHSFYKLSETASQVFTAGSPDFCLMCHADKGRIDDTKVPQINHAEHYEMMDIKDMNTPCFECHGDEMIHRVNKTETPDSESTESSKAVESTEDTAATEELDAQAVEQLVPAVEPATDNPTVESVPVENAPGTDAVPSESTPAGTESK